MQYGYLDRVVHKTSHHASSKIHAKSADVLCKNLSVSRIGGSLALPSLSGELETTAPSLAVCRVCQGPLLVVAQLWASYDTAGFNRIVYIMCCERAATQSQNSAASSSLTDPKAPLSSQLRCLSLSDPRAWRVTRVLFPFSCEAYALISNKADPAPLAGSVRASTPWGSVSATTPIVDSTSSEKRVDTAVNAETSVSWMDAYLDMCNTQKSDEARAFVQCPETPEPADALGPEKFFDQSKVVYATPTNADGALPCIELTFSDAKEFTLGSSNTSLDRKAQSLAETFKRRCENGELEKEDALDLATFHEKDDSKASTTTIHQGADRVPGRQWEPEPYEPPSLEEKHYFKFQKEMERFPGHVLRYGFNAHPVWPTLPAFYLPPKDEGSLQAPRCSECGGERVFECQLMSSLLWLLQERVERMASGPDDLLQKFLENSDWGTVAVFTCKNDCHHFSAATPQPEEPPVFREEVVAVSTSL